MANHENLYGHPEAYDIAFDFRDEKEAWRMIPVLRLR
jgi:hypothetical protein